MNYSTFIHSGIVNPTKLKSVTETTTDTVDHVVLDVPLLIRLLELAREEIKTDADLHHVVTSMLQLKNQGVLTMNDYDKIVQKKKVDAELESILKLSGI